MQFLVMNSISLFIFVFFIFFVTRSDGENIVVREEKVLRQRLQNTLNPEDLYRLGHIYKFDYNCSEPYPLEHSIEWCRHNALLLFSRSRELILHEVFSREDISFDYPGMLIVLGSMLSSTGRSIEAVQVYEEALQWSPNNPTAITSLASELILIAEYEQAERLLLQAYHATDRPSFVITYHLGLLKYRQEFAEEAEYYWYQALQTAVSGVDELRVYELLAMMKCKQENYTAANQYFWLAINTSCQINDMSRMWLNILKKDISVMPVIVVNDTEVLRIRKSYVRALYNILVHAPLNSINVSPIHTVGCNSIGYYIIYHGYEDLYMRQMQAVMYYHMFQAQLVYHNEVLLSTLAEEKAMENQSSRITINPVDTTSTMLGVDAADYMLYPLNASMKIRVAFVSAYFCRHSVGLLLKGVIKNLNHNIFDVYVIGVPRLTGSPMYEDSVTDELKGYSPSHSHYISLTGNLGGIQRSIAAMNIDVLVYGEIGMDAMTYFLSFSTLSRRSILFWGHATTSGVTNVHQMYTRIMSNKPALVQQLEKFALDDDGVFDMTAFQDVFHNNNSHHHKIDVDSPIGPDYFVSSLLFEGNSQGSSEVSYHHICKNCNVHQHCTSSNTSTETSCVHCIKTHNICSDMKQKRKSNTFYSQLEYSERLILMNGLTTYFEAPVPPLSATDLNMTSYIQANVGDTLLPAKRDYLLYLNPEVIHVLPFDGAPLHIYCIPQTLYKLHSDFDSMIIEILNQDSAGYIVIPQATGRNRLRWVDQLIKRLRRAAEGYWPSDSLNSSEGHYMRIDSIMNRVLFVRSMNEREYITLCAVSDVILDPFPVGGGRSSLEILSVGTPIVVLKTRHSILQLTYAMYVVAGVEMTKHCCVAYDAKEYVAMALHVGNDESYRNQLKRQILNGKSLIFENKQVIEEWEKMLLFVNTAPRPVPISARVADFEFERLSCGDCKNDDSSSCSCRSSKKSGDCIEYDTLHNNLRRIQDSNPLWLEKELAEVLFTHTAPPIILEDV